VIPFCFRKIFALPLTIHEGFFSGFFSEPNVHQARTRCKFARKITLHIRRGSKIKILSRPGRAGCVPRAAMLLRRGINGVHVELEKDLFVLFLKYR